MIEKGALKRFAEGGEDGKRSDLPGKPKSKEEARALEKLRAEAKAKGSFLASGGEGGLPSSLVLKVMRRDDYTCKNCGELGDEEKNGGISMHHKGGIVDSVKESNRGHKNNPNNLSTVCVKCHDKMHKKARKEGTDSSQVLAKADQGTRRDHGQPLARPER